MIESKYMELDINSIELDENNPRIKQALEIYQVVSEDHIAIALNTSTGESGTSFSSLKESIRVNGGIINPITVNYNSKENKYVVIEGNTRLQIYKDFNRANPDEPRWQKIRSLVYTDMQEEEIHSVRLQAHLVGPRDWDPYSKAKYLDYLWNKERLPLATIISFCGGKKNEIMKLVSAYRDMQEYYLPALNEDPDGAEFDAKDFSKYSELQNKSIIDALTMNHFTKKDFTKWVINKNIDTAQNVRQLPLVLKDKNARTEFLKSNISNALKKLNLGQSAIDLSHVDYMELAKALKIKLDKFGLAEARKLWSPAGEDNRALLISLVESVEFVLNEDADEE